MMLLNLVIFRFRLWKTSVFAEAFRACWKISANETIIDEKYNLISYKELETSKTYNNYLYFIKKNSYSGSTKEIKYITPIFNDKLEIVLYNNTNYYKSNKLHLYFPIIDNIPILLIDNEICIK